jgi:hypothetical protein
MQKENLKFSISNLNPQSKICSFLSALSIIFFPLRASASSALKIPTQNQTIIDIQTLRGRLQIFSEPAQHSVVPELGVLWL